MPVLGQVVPVGVHRFDKIYLLAAAPTLDFLLTCNCSARICEPFIVNQACEVITTREARDQLVLVLEDATWEIAGYACVQGVRARSISHDVDVEKFGWAHEQELTAEGVWGL